MGKYLAMYDLSGIQDFIFQTNRLKEIAGASYIVSKALFANVPELAGEAPDAWKTRPIDGFNDLGPRDARVVYIGGGNALVVFGSAEVFGDFTRSLKRRVFQQAGGALRVCSACVPVAEGARLAECLDFANPNGLRARLDRSKAKAPQPLTARGFSVNKLDNESYEPIVFFPEPIDDRGERRRFMPRSRRLKLEEYRRQHGPADRRDYTSPLLELQEDREFEVEFDGFFQGGKPGRAGKRFLAVVHADGNTMGQRIARFLDACGKRDQSFEQDLIDMRDLSLCIGEAYKNALGRMIDDVYGRCEGALPFRPVVADGDDITFICRSEVALECVARFVDALHDPDLIHVQREGLPRPDEFSVGAGIALVKSSYPFSSAYEMAEELCKNAKAAAFERLLSGEVSFSGTAGQVGQPPVSSVDFHVCAGELVKDIADFRERYLTQRDADGDKVLLCMRPYHLGIDSPPGDSGEGSAASMADRADFSFDAFRRALGELQERSKGENAWIARSKLKGLRDKYGEGVEQIGRYCKTIAERDMAMRRSGVKGGAESEAFIRKFEKPYVVAVPANPNGTCRYARFFDALDLIDLCDGVAASGDEAKQRERGSR